MVKVRGQVRTRTCMVKLRAENFQKISRDVDVANVTSMVPGALIQGSEIILYSTRRIGLPTTLGLLRFLLLSSCLCACIFILSHLVLT